MPRAVALFIHLLLSLLYRTSLNVYTYVGFHGILPYFIMVTKRADTGQKDLRNQTVQTLDLFWYGLPSSWVHGMEHNTSLPMQQTTLLCG